MGCRPSTARITAAATLREGNTIDLIIINLIIIIIKIIIIIINFIIIKYMGNTIYFYILRQI